MILSSILVIDPDKVDRDLGFLMQCFREVLEEEGEQTLADYLPWQGGATLLSIFPLQNDSLKRTLLLFSC